MRAGAGGERADFARPVRIADVEGAHPRVLVGGEDELRAHEASRPVLVDVVRSEVAALAHIVGLRRRGKGGDAHRICLGPVVEHPDELEAILLVIEHGFVEHDEKIALRQRQAIVRAAAERRAPVAVDNELRFLAVADVDPDHAGVAPGGVGRVAVNDCVMQAVAPRRRP